ncbi:conjugal transfer protein TraX [Lysobacter maris]|uniref:Conjugal transfer protein TraX n=1 Tax=Marilutibacter maris TaxID=1605891 RepID=A0A508AVE2_9GAMM|nr:TraX family protein [Lysobacter maris]KAB8191355.1 conjugal transfer protein TraX [Lysobacter maris]
MVTASISTHCRSALSFGDSSIEFAKWIAFALMLVDHVNAVFMDRQGGVAIEVLGRMAMPVFAFVLAYNLSRPSVNFQRVLRRLLLFGLVSMPAHAFLFGVVGPWPLNIMATFAVSVAVIMFLRSGDRLSAIALFLVGSCLVEYWHAGTGLVVAFWLFLQGSRLGFPAIVAAFGALCLVNGNAWALFAFPLLHIVRLSPVAISRSRWAFWMAYPLHLSVLAVLTLELVFFPSGSTFICK